MQGRVLIVAGSDSGGGAGIQADIKTVTALGGYAATAITAVTVQNTLGVQDIEAMPPALVDAQMQAVLGDIGADAIKIGMLFDAAMIDQVAITLSVQENFPPVVLDPVMVAKGGASLLQVQAVQALKDKLIPQAFLVTPNVPEAEELTEQKITGPADMVAAGQVILAMGAQNVLVKGGHLEGDLLTDVLVTKDGHTAFEARRIDTRHTHGTGCTTASAIAVSLAQGMDLPTAVATARTYVREAIRSAPGYGRGHGPLNHGHPLQGKS